MTRRLLPLCLLLCAAAAQAGVRGELGVEATGYTQPAAQGQDDAGASVWLKPNAWHDAGAHRFEATLFARGDSLDEERTHTDVREAFWSWRTGFSGNNQTGDGSLELRAGVRQVFWGVTEGTHLVDIVNQTDSVDALDGEQKLGQPMLGLALERGAHALDVALLAGARERTFAGRDGRLRLPLLVDRSLTAFESGNGRSRIDGALRYQYNDNGLRLGLSLFGGNAREPELHPVVDPAQLVYSGGMPVAFAPGYQPVLAPFYPVILQAGIDAQYTAGDWLWKLEAIERIGQLDPFQAVDAGFEYTQVGALSLRDGSIDIGWLAELLWDSRDNVATTPFEHDLLLGARFAFNDTASSELLASLIVDLHSSEQLWSLEGSRRFGDSLKLALETRVFAGMPAPQDAFAFLVTPDSDHKLRPLAHDDYLRLSLTWFF